MLKQISAILVQTIASVLLILQPFCSYFHVLQTKITTKNSGNKFLHFSRRFQPLNRRRIKERGEGECERKWLAKRMKDTEGKIKGIVASRTVCRWGRMSQCLACPQASSATDALLVYTAGLQRIKHEYRSVQMVNTYLQVCSSSTSIFIHSMYDTPTSCMSINTNVRNSSTSDIGRSVYIYVNQWYGSYSEVWQIPSEILCL